jgi:hypothetical protein
VERFNFQLLTLQIRLTIRLTATLDQVARGASNIFLFLDVLNGGFAGATSQTKHQMKSRFFLNVVVSQSATILQLLTGEDQALLVRGNT